MDPQYERRLRNEVIYLHSLWHRGPPRAVAIASTAWPVVEFSFTNGKRRRETPQESNSYHGIEARKSKLDSIPPPSSQDLSKSDCNQAHERALKAAHEFFLNRGGDDEDEICFSSDEDDELMEEDDGREEYSFFLKLFEENDELKQYYEKRFRKGEFYCLICSVIGEKNYVKKYRGCLPLVQHSISVAKTKKRRAHRAFAQAVCKILEWDINLLPSLVSTSSTNGETGENKNGENTRLTSELKDDEEDPGSSSFGAEFDDGVLITGLTDELSDDYPEYKRIKPVQGEHRNGVENPLASSNNSDKPQTVNPAKFEEELRATSVLQDENNGAGMKEEKRKKKKPVTGRE